MAHSEPLTTAPSGISEFLVRWGDLLDAAKFAVIVADLRTVEVCLCNEVATTALGFTPLTLTDLFATVEDLAVVADAVKRFDRWEGRLSDGRGAVATAIPGIGGPAGLYIGLVGSGLEPPRRLASALLEGAESAFLAVDASGRIVIANEHARLLLGPDLIGRFLIRVASPGALRALAPGPPVVEDVGSPGGPPRRIEWRSAADLSAPWPLWGRDVTDVSTAQRALEERLRRVEAIQEISAAVARGSPVADVAALALLRMEGLFRLREGRVTLVEVDALRALALRRDGVAVVSEGRTLLSLSPAREARSRRTVIQRPISDAQHFPALHALEAMGVRWALLVPLRVEEAIFGFVEIYGDEDAFPPHEVEIVRQVACLISASLVRERQLDQLTRHAHAMEQRVARRNEELHRTNEQLIQAAKLSSIGELAAGLVHELNQPLNVIGGYVELLTEGSLSEKSRTRALEVMARAVNRMTVMAENLRNFSRADGRVMAPVDLFEVVHVARELTAGAIRRNVKVDCPPGIWVFGTATRLEQVVINLLANALQSDGDPVRIRVYADVGEPADGDRAVIEVTDRGPGVPEALRERIFDSFFTTKPPGQGTGLGLSVSGRIIQEHGGRIEVDENPGGGALFRIVLPLHRARPPEGVRPPDGSGAVDGGTPEPV